MTAVLTGAAAATPVTLVENGTARAVVCVPADLMEADRKVTGKDPYLQQRAEIERQRLRDSVHDLIHYLEVMSSGKLELHEGRLAPGDQRLPLYVGTLATEVFGPPEKPYPYEQGWRLVVCADGIGLIGESDLAASYALYEVLHRLGCRWYMPGELGEHIPRLSTVALEVTDLSATPATVYRGLWSPSTFGSFPGGGVRLSWNEPFNRRNRQGGLPLVAAHSLERHISDEQRAAHPEWCAVVDGKPHAKHIKWTRADVADAVADAVIVNLDAKYQPVYALSPADSAAWDEEEDPQHDPGDWDVAMNRVSKTDRWLMLVNRVAERVGKKYPDVFFSTLIYVDYTRPPVREPVHPQVIPYIAPITYNRAKPMASSDGQPWQGELLEMVKGWQQLSPYLGYYWYGYNLSETWAPNPFITKWGRDLPVLFRGARYPCWFPETSGNFETTFIGLNLGMRLSWDATLEPEAVIAELLQNFYGAAATSMGAYWHHIDRAWVETPGDPGAAWGYRRYFTTEVLQEARCLLDAALAECQTALEYRRVEIANLSLRQFEQFMQLEEELATGRLKGLADGFERWWQVNHDLSERFQVRAGWYHRENYLFGLSPYRYDWIAKPHGRAFREAARIAAGYEILTPKMLRHWRWQAAASAEDDVSAWLQPEFDDAAWPVADVTRDTTSFLGLHHSFTPLVYRCEVELPAAGAGVERYLWLSRSVGLVHAYVNGQPLKWLSEQGEELEEFAGYAKPVSARISNLVKADGKNVIAIKFERSGLDEVGAHGLIGPLLIYQDKAR